MAARANEELVKETKEAPIGYFDMIATPMRRLLRGGQGRVSTSSSPRNLVKNLFSSPHKTKGSALQQCLSFRLILIALIVGSREGTPRKIAPKDKVNKDKPDNRFSPLTKPKITATARSPARSSPDPHKRVLTRTPSQGCSALHKIARE